ncbi:MAG: metallophosphoesterase family protein [Desulfosalsimonadaceae bacterium]
MRTAVISDIHGNATAFEAVLADLEKQEEIAAVYCLGDNVGYGPEPEKVVSLLQRQQIPSVLGNHELAINKPETLSWFNPAARTSLEKTMQMLSAATKAFLAGLPAFLIREGCRYVHGFPPDSPTTYLFEVNPEEIRQTLNRLEERIVFIGHTHELLIIGNDGKTVNTSPLYEGTIQLDPGKQYLINIGSVGQPRDGGKEAKYVIYDNSAGELTVRFVDYDVEDTVQKIYRQGLPEQHAWRLL